MKPRLAISFSGGRSSAVMLKVCLDKYDATHDISILFANTGSEHEDTLRFVDAVDRKFAGGRVVWIEAVINGKGIGPTAKVVDYATASRDHEPFRAAIEKHGVFNKSYPNCTGRLKTEPMHFFWRYDIGWEAGSYDTAIGIRADEADRMSDKRKQKRFVYPLVTGHWTKKSVNDYMSQFDWDLNLPNDGFGNCVWCWKKSLRKLATVAVETPEAFDFPTEMEAKHGEKSNGQPNPEPRVFFRGNRSAQDILEIARKGDFRPYRDSEYHQGELFTPWLDVGGGCGDSCEIGADE